MDVCQILLGSPWLFDKHRMHDGHANTYVLKFKGRSPTLAPLPPAKPLKIKLGKRSNKSLHMSEIPVKKATSKSKPLFFLLIVESNTSDVVKP